MYKKPVSLLLVGAIVLSLFSIDMTPKFSYASTMESNYVATPSEAKQTEDNKKDDDIEIAPSSNTSRKEHEEEEEDDIIVATSSNAVIATDSNATIATSSEAEQKVFDFEKIIKDISLLKQEDYSVVSKENPIYSDESLILRFEYKLKSSIKKELSEGRDIVYEYQLPDDVLNLIENYDDLVGETFADAPDSDTLGYTGEFCDNGQVKITLLSTDDVDDSEKCIDVPLVIRCGRENIPDKIRFSAGSIKKITVYFYVGFNYEETIDDVTIRLTAGNSTLPKNVEVRISKVSQDDELEKALRDSIEGFKREETIAFDISFWDGENEINIEDGMVKVSFTYPEFSEDGDTKVFHLDDNDKLEMVPCVQESDEISFEANHFSVYGFTITYAQDTDPLGNPLIGGTTSGDWKGNYVYFGWEGLESNKNNGNDNWLEIKDYVNNNEFYRLNGQLYSGADLMTPVKWRILNNNGSALLLLSDEMLDVYNYGTASNDHPTWETSDIRHWLNDEFMKNHFTSDEQADIKESTVTDIVSPDSNLPEGNSTEDKIFLPSREELTEENFGFPVNGESLSRKTTYNNDSLRARNTAGDKSYWTRSRGDLNYTFLRPVFVTEKGQCGYGSNRYCSWILGVRPMLRLDVDSQRFGFNKTDDNLSAGIKFDKASMEMMVGDIKDLEVIPININDNMAGLKWVSTDPSVVSLGIDGKLSAMSNGTANIYAIQGQYVAMCRVTVKENPKQQYKVTFKDGDTIIREVMVEENTSAIAPVITKDGYTLTWDKDCSNITEAIVINAIWTGNTYNITYVMNGGINHNLNPANYTVGGIGVALQRPTFVGYVFEGWFTTSDFKAGTEIMLIAPNHVGDVIVYAKWKAEENNDQSSSGNHGSSGGGGSSSGSINTQKKPIVNDLYFNSDAMSGFILPIGSSADMNEYLIIDTNQEDEIELNWKSSDESVVTVQNGVISCKKDGFADVSVSPKYDSSKVARVLIRSVAPRVNDPAREPVDNYHYNTGTWAVYPMPNCTAYAWGRAFEIIGIEPGLSINNASQWEGQNNAFGGIFKSGNEPRRYSVACLTGKNHVQIVEDIVNINGIKNSGAMEKWLKFSNYKYDSNGNVVIFSQSAKSGYGSGRNYYQVDSFNFGGGVNTLNFVYGPQTGWPNDDTVDKYLYLDLNPYIDGTTKVTDVTNNMVKIEAQFKNTTHNNDLKSEGYYIGKKRSQLNIGKENPVSSTSGAVYHQFAIEDLESDTTYYYQFFLKGANGVEYRGDIFEFTTK